MTKEIVIEGINPPTQNFAYPGATITTTQIPVQPNLTLETGRLLKNFHF